MPTIAKPGGGAETGLSVTMDSVACSLPEVVGTVAVNKTRPNMLTPRLC
jgi:hypothetical protein